MNPKTILVTGATSGIGASTATLLAKQGHTVLCHGRTQEKVDRAVAATKDAGGHDRVHGFVADLSDLDSIRAMATAVQEAHPDLAVLVNNAGGWNPDRTTTKQGHETTFGVNHLAPFVLTLALLPVLEKNKARVVSVASMLHTRGVIEMDDLQRSSRSYDGMGAYNDSKLANVLFAAELARRHPAITSNSLHPGVVKTHLATDKPGFQAWFFRNILQRFFALQADDGAATSVFLATDPSVDGVTGKYFAKCAEVTPSAAGQDEAMAKRLWEASEALVA
ncbi:MAG: SDR family oxidoreductase [Deltaproteobacteria bacterium]|nr:SDR family oxidoreductase [Deltaproteobacteria bacterium]